MAQQAKEVVAQLFAEDLGVKEVVRQHLRHQYSH